MRRLAKDNLNSPQHMDWVWQQPDMHRFDYERLNFLIRQATATDRVLDVGAGKFGACEYMNDPKMELHAVDFSKVAIEHINATASAVKAVLWDIREGLPYPDGMFDCVILGEIVEHWEEPQKLINEAVRVCKTGGWLTLSTVNTASEDAKKHGAYPEHLFEFTQEDLEALFVNAGCSEVHYSTVGNYMCIEAMK